ncbi:hypothetical protein P8452_36871 [Trifolium repens]|nr:hypothetical protein P8452_36871 [Trifolium repens]
MVLLAAEVNGTVPPYTCKKGHTTNDPLIKYKLDVEIYDGDDTANLIVKCFPQLGLGDPHEYPLCLDDIMEMKFAFRVKWQTGWGEQVVAINESPPIQVDYAHIYMLTFSKFACLDDSILFTANVSASVNNEIYASSHKTPAKGVQ